MEKQYRLQLLATYQAGAQVEHFTTTAIGDEKTVHQMIYEALFDATPDSMAQIIDLTKRGKPSFAKVEKIISLAGSRKLLGIMEG
jgi:hypothetical protein